MPKQVKGCCCYLRHRANLIENVFSFDIFLGKWKPTAEFVESESPNYSADTEQNQHLGMKELWEAAQIQLKVFE